MNPLIILIFLPSFVCFFWLFTNLYLARRTSTFEVIQCFSTALLFYFVADGFYSTPGIAPEVLVYSRLFVVGAGPCLIPLILLYFYKLHLKRPFHAIHFIWIVLPVSLLIAGVVFTEISERPVIARFLSDLFTIGSSIVPDYRGTTLWHFYIWTRIIFMIVIALELFVGVVYLMRFVIRDKVSFKHLWRFFFNGESIKVTELQIFNLLIVAIYIAAKLIFIKGFLDTHVWFSVFLAFLVSFGYSSLMFCSLFGEKESITLVQAKHVMFYNYNPAIKGPVVEIMMGLREVDDYPWDIVEKYSKQKQLKVLTDDDLEDYDKQLLNSVGKVNNKIIKLHIRYFMFYRYKKKNISRYSQFQMIKKIYIIL